MIHNNNQLRHIRNGIKILRNTNFLHCELFLIKDIGDAMYANEIATYIIGK